MVPIAMAWDLPIDSAMLAVGGSLFSDPIADFEGFFWRTKQRSGDHRSPLL
jgi:hypothetical protein